MSPDCCAWRCSPPSWCQIAADDMTTHALPLLSGMLASLGDMQTHNHPARLLATAAAAPLAQLLHCLFFVYDYVVSLKVYKAQISSMHFCCSYSLINFDEVVVNVVSFHTYCFYWAAVGLCRLLRLSAYSIYVHNVCLVRSLCT